MQLIIMLADNDVFHGNTIYCSVSQGCQLVAGEELEITVSKTYSPTQIALDEFHILPTPLSLSYETY
jgi:beta-lactam-binding protein with PASTA domain